MLMQIILVKITLYVTEKCQKKIKIKFHCFIFWQNPIKVKTNAPKIQTFSNSLLLQAQPALACYWPVIAVLQLCADGMATV